MFVPRVSVPPNIGIADGKQTEKKIKKKRTVLDWKVNLYWNHRPDVNRIRAVPQISAWTYAVREEKFISVKNRKVDVTDRIVDSAHTRAHPTKSNDGLAAELTFDDLSKSISA